jgi:hypothetical protein
MPRLRHTWTRSEAWRALRAAVLVFASIVVTVVVIDRPMERCLLGIAGFFVLTQILVTTVVLLNPGAASSDYGFDGVTRDLSPRISESTTELQPITRLRPAFFAR